MSEPMKVYIVTAGEWSDYRIVAVFSSESTAGKYCYIRNQQNDYESFNVEEYEMDLATVNDNTEEE